MRAEIEKRLDQEFERSLFRAALGNLDDASNPLRFNNFAYSTRELVRHVLKRLAPDEHIRYCCWYKNETKQENGISRRQRVTYRIRFGLVVVLDLKFDTACEEPTESGSRNRSCFMALVE